MTNWITPDDVRALVRYVPVLILLLVILWAGQKGYWYWGSGARAAFAAIERDRDEWRKLAQSLLADRGITITREDSVASAVDHLERDPS